MAGRVRGDGGKRLGAHPLPPVQCRLAKAAPQARAESRGLCFRECFCAAARSLVALPLVWGVLNFKFSRSCRTPRPQNCATAWGVCIFFAESGAARASRLRAPTPRMRVVAVVGGGEGVATTTEGLSMGQSPTARGRGTPGPVSLRTVLVVVGNASGDYFFHRGPPARPPVGELQGGAQGSPGRSQATRGGAPGMGPRGHRRGTAIEQNRSPRWKKKKTTRRLPLPQDTSGMAHARIRGAESERGVGTPARLRTPRNICTLPTRWRISGARSPTRPGEFKILNPPD